MTKSTRPLLHTIPTEGITPREVITEGTSGTTKGPTNAKTMGGTSGRTQDQASALHVENLVVAPTTIRRRRDNVREINSNAPATAPSGTTKLLTLKRTLDSKNA